MLVEVALRDFRTGADLGDGDVVVVPRPEQVQSRGEDPLTPVRRALLAGKPTVILAPPGRQRRPLVHVVQGSSTDRYLPHTAVRQPSTLRRDRGVERTIHNDMTNHSWPS